MKNRDWIICYDGTHGDKSYAMECRRCGAVQKVAIPIQISVWAAGAKAFQKIHRKCFENNERPTNPL